MQSIGVLLPLFRLDFRLQVRHNGKTRGVRCLHLCYCIPDLRVNLSEGGAQYTRPYYCETVEYPSPVPTGWDFEDIP